MALLPGGGQACTPSKIVCAHFLDPLESSTGPEVRFLGTFCQNPGPKTLRADLARVWGGVRKVRAGEFYPIFDLLGLFWRILCTLAHFGENMVILGTPRKWVTAK